ncbi:MAG: hypothetical protein H6835_08205 [Planctomycetes bacterium]|nr:hypothetical protein [Planctomycetota bacterium]
MATRSSKWWLPFLAAVMVGCASTDPAALDVAASNACACCGEFPAPDCLLCGFDAAEPDGDWRVGDELLYGLRLRRGDEVQNWLLRLRVTDPLLRDDGGHELDPVEWKIRINGELQRFSSRRCRVAATVLDATGHVLGESRPELPRDFLDRGLGSACRKVERDRRRRHRRRWHAEEPELPLRPLAEATVSAVALLQVIERDSVLAPLLWEVVEKPSLWSVISNLGAKVVVKPRFYELEHALSPVAAVPVETWRVPISLFVNDAAALHVELMVADSAPPYAVGCGMLGATARHPSNPDVDFSVLLLAARRGGLPVADAAR